MAEIKAVGVGINLLPHATQVLVAPGGEQFALSNFVAQPVFDHEHFVLVRGRLGLTDSAGREDDLFSGIG